MISVLKNDGIIILFPQGSFFPKIWKKTVIVIGNSVAGLSDENLSKKEITVRNTNLVAQKILELADEEE